MRGLQSLVVTPELCSLVGALHDRLNPIDMHVGAGFEPFVASLQLVATAPAGENASRLIVDFAAGVLKQIAGTTEEFGFVMPTAQIARPWQRANSWRDDATLELWHDGWSPIAVDRIVVAASGCMIEFVIGNARRTPLAAETT